MIKEILIKCSGSDSLALNEMNNFQDELKILTDENKEKLKKSLIKYNFSFPFFVWKDESGKIWKQDGHQREKVLIELEKEGYKLPEKYPVIFIEAKNKKEAAEKLLIQSSNYGTIDEQGLFNFQQKFNLDLPDLNLKLPDINFERFDLKFNQPEGLTDADEVPEVSEKAISKLGDLWLLGDKHRLLCGDATKKDNYNKLMKNEIENIIVTDPPYVVNYDPKWRSKLHKKNSYYSGKIIQNDDNYSWLLSFDNVKADVIYMWMGSLNINIIQTELGKLDYELKYIIIWNKDLAIMGRGDYHWKHEMCLYFVKKGRKHNWQKSRKENTVWDIAAIQSFARGNKKPEWGLVGHGNQKPVECMKRPIVNNTKSGEIVLDLFIGSGTTLIACEKTNRICYGIEIDLSYCDVIINRWQNYTGKEAIREDGIKFNDLFEQNTTNKR